MDFLCINIKFFDIIHIIVFDGIMILNEDETNTILVWGEQKNHELQLPTGSQKLNDILHEMKRNIIQIYDKFIIDIGPNIHTYNTVKSN